MRRAHVVLGMLAVLTAVVLVPTQAPIYLGSATSGSMAPTISTGDAYLVRATDDAAVGDIVMFYSEKRGTYVTHRIVDRTDEGFITKGDANPSTDQADSHPPVQASAIVGKVVTVTGTPVVLPVLGVPIRLVRSNGVLALALVVLLGVALAIRDRVESGPERSLTRVGDVVPPLLAGAAILGVAAISLGASTHALTYVAVAEDTPPEHTIPLGEGTTADVTLTVSSPGLNQLVVHADGVAVVGRERIGSQVRLTVAVPPPETTGPKRATITAATYPPTLPRGVLDWLYERHPILASGSAVGVVLLPLYLVYALALDPKRPVRALGTSVRRGDG